MYGIGEPHLVKRCQNEFVHLCVRRLCPENNARCAQPSAFRYFKNPYPIRIFK